MPFATTSKFYPEHQATVTKLKKDGVYLGYCQWAVLLEGDVMIEFIGIFEKHRRKGYGTILMKLIAVRAQELNATYLYLNETIEGGKENKFFQNLGFCYVGDDNEMRVEVRNFREQDTMIFKDNSKAFLNEVEFYPELY